MHFRLRKRARLM